MMLCYNLETDEDTQETVAKQMIERHNLQNVSTWRMLSSDANRGSLPVADCCNATTDCNDENTDSLTD